MSTQSIRNNIVITNQESARTFIEALERASQVATDFSSQDNIDFTELKDARHIKDFLGEVI